MTSERKSPTGRNPPTRYQPFTDPVNQNFQQNYGSSFRPLSDPNAIQVGVDTSANLSGNAFRNLPGGDVNNILPQLPSGENPASLLTGSGMNENNWLTGGAGGNPVGGGDTSGAGNGAQQGWWAKNFGKDGNLIPGLNVLADFGKLYYTDKMIDAQEDSLAHKINFDTMNSYNVAQTTNAAIYDRARAAGRQRGMSDQAASAYADSVLQTRKVNDLSSYS